MSFSKAPRELGDHDGQTLTHAEFKQLMTERFGEDSINWAFRCPNCGDVASGVDFRAALEANPREKRGDPVTWNDIVGQECIGRTLGALETDSEGWAARLADPADPARGCNWVAYGLLSGPVRVVVAHNVAVHTFPIAEPVADPRPEGATA